MTLTALQNHMVLGSIHITNRKLVPSVKKNTTEAKRGYKFTAAYENSIESLEGSKNNPEKLPEEISTFVTKLSKLAVHHTVNIVYTCCGVSP